MKEVRVLIVTAVLVNCSACTSLIINDHVISGYYDVFSDVILDYLLCITNDDPET